MYSTNYHDVETGKISYDDYMIAEALWTIKHSEKGKVFKLTDMTLEEIADRVYAMYGGRSIESAIMRWFIQ